MQNTNEKEDLRVFKTRFALQTALIELTIEKGFPPITVRDIARRARVNRSTFYRHYLDKYDLLDQYVQELYTAMDGRHAEKPGEPPPALVKMLTRIQEDGAFFRVMFSERGDPVFACRMRQNTEQRWRELLALNETDATLPPVDVRVAYIANAAIGAITWWLDNEQPCSVEQLARWISQLNVASAGLKLPLRAAQVSAS